MRFRKPLLLVVALGLAGGAWFLARARIRATAVAGSAKDQPKPRQAAPPHGGTPVELGDEQFFVELVRDPPSGTLQAFILDGEMEDFIRIRARVLELQVEHHGRKETLKLLPVADAATGETVGDTCLFRTRAEWLKHEDHFQGAVRNLAIQDQTFPFVPFRFPEGNKKD